MCSYHMSLSVRPAGELRAFASRHPSGVAAVVMEAPPAMRSIVDVYVHIYIYIYIHIIHIYIYMYMVVYRKCCLFHGGPAGVRSCARKTFASDGQISTLTLSRSPA